MSGDNDLKPWGESWSPGIRMSIDIDCPSCGWLFIMNRSLEKFNAVVGFSNQIPFETKGLGIKILIGIIIVECPKCFEKFCFHTDANFARSCRDYCDSWPKTD